MAERRDSVREAYENLGLERHQVSRLTGISPSTLTNFIAGQPLSRPKATRLGDLIGWTADEVLSGERKLNREKDGRDGEHVSPKPLPPARPAQEPKRPPNRPDSQRGAA